MIKRAISKNFFEAKELGKYYVGDRRIPRKMMDVRNIETKICIYEDMVKTWFLDAAKYLVLPNKAKINGEEFDTNEAGFVILQIAISYIEGNQQYREGKSSINNSKKFFIAGMERIFSYNSPCSKRKLEEFYDQVRCGLFHNAMTGKKVTINGDFKYRIMLTKNEIKINPYKFLDAVCKDFYKYVKQLKNKKNNKLIENFKLRLAMKD